MLVAVTSRFAADRIAKNFTTDLRASAVSALGDRARYRLDVVTPTEQPGLLPDGDEDGDKNSDNGTPANGHSAPANEAGLDNEAGLENEFGNDTDNAFDSGAIQTEPPKSRANVNSYDRSHSTKRRVGKLGSLLNASTLTNEPQQASGKSPQSRAKSKPAADSSTHSAPLPPLPESFPTGGRTLESFLTGPCNEFAFSAATMAITTPEVATPLFLHGPTGTGKSHLLYAIAEEFRRRRRMRRVVLLTAEQFTNDFVTSVSSSGLPAFRRRYREVDALLIDDVHFLAAKTATLREALYTVESLTAAGKPLVFTANLPPADIRGLTGEVAGRMASGLVCPLTTLDPATRFALLKRLIKTRCVLECDDELLQEVSESSGGDARAVTGIANLIGMLQRMYRREPTIEEVRRHGGDLLRNTRSAPSLRSIERAVCEAFGIENDGLRGKAQTKRVSEPRTLAMYLARQHTGSAFTEIAQHFGRRSHSGAIAAQQKVEIWLTSGKAIGGGDAAMSAKEAIARVEARLRVG